MDILDDGVLVTYRDLSEHVQKLLMNAGYEGTGKIRVISYPSDKPILFSNLEYDFEMASNIENLHNLRSTFSVGCAASRCYLFEKVNPSEEAYAIFYYYEFGHSKTEQFSIIKID